MKNIRPSVLVFLILGLAMAAGLTYMTQWAQPHAANNEDKAMKAFIHNMIPEKSPNITTQSFVLLAPNYLKMGDVQHATRVLDDNKPIQVIYHALSTKAYRDRIGVMASFDNACTITHVEILSHKETPGLGDQFKKDDKAWLKSLVGKTSNTHWALKPKGDIDTWTGATVTPQAIIDTLHRMQSLCVDQHNLLFSHEGMLYLEVGNPQNPEHQRPVE